MGHPIRTVKELTDTMKKYLVCLLSLLFITPTWAATDSKSLQEEIVYRASLGRADDVKLLIEQGASPNATNSESTPLLSLAAIRTDSEAIPVIDALLVGSADINAKDALGQTALFHAARVNNEDIVMHLLEKGIDYYRTDNNGDVARNIAHKEGFSQLVAKMDGFVVDQSKKVQKQYEDYNRMLQKRYDEQRRIVEEYESQEEGEAGLGEEEYQKALQKMENIRAEREKVAMENRTQPTFEEDLRKLSYTMCAFQYWSYCRSVRLTTEIKGGALDKEIDTYAVQIPALSKFLTSEYMLEKPYVDSIAERAQKRIFYQLEKMPSNTYRFQEGVGKIADVETRCQRIAGYWNVELTPQEKDPTSLHKKKKKNQAFSDEDDE